MVSSPGRDRCTIQRYYRTKVLMTKGLFGQRYYKTKVLSGTKTDQYLIFDWDMELWPFNHPLMSQSKVLNPNPFLGRFHRRFQCRLSSVTITRSGATPACAVTSPWRMLTRHNITLAVASVGSFCGQRYSWTKSIAIGRKSGFRTEMDELIIRNNIGW